MVPNIEQDYILLFGYSILYKEYNLAKFNHQKNATHLEVLCTCNLLSNCSYNLIMSRV